MGQQVDTTSIRDRFVFAPHGGSKPKLESSFPDSHLLPILDVAEMSRFSCNTSRARLGQAPSTVWRNPHTWWPLANVWPHCREVASRRPGQILTTPGPQDAGLAWGAAPLLYSCFEALACPFRVPGNLQLLRLPPSPPAQRHSVHLAHRPESADSSSTPLADRPVHGAASTPPPLTCPGEANERLGQGAAKTRLSLIRRVPQAGVAETRVLWT